MRSASTVSRRGGFTLVEVMLASAVLAIAVVGLSQAIVSGQAQTYDGMHSARAVSLAEALMDEILAEPYVDLNGDTTPGPDTGETTRLSFDCIDDFNGYAESSGTLRDLGGTLYPELFQAFDRSVAVTYTTVNYPLLGGDRGGMHITVTVTDPGGGRTWTLDRFIAEPQP